MHRSRIDSWMTTVIAIIYRSVRSCCCSMRGHGGSRTKSDPRGKVDGRSGVTRESAVSVASSIEIIGQGETFLAMLEPRSKSLD